ncbi:Alanine--tRNA ligase (Alanyl-tRNA synthetase) (AlaRS) [Durusdinium trenchii]|uniref:Alanine--tRNA ligase n=1 Tax=Durusdinium trenchii TaxID=1381693 RepID=A0ABP0SQH9_9DINO
MVQFKDAFLGKERRAVGRAVSSQKCVRAGGKHNDLDNVGRTPRHHTFFEMLGNFSFGDYFKEEAMVKAWSFVHGELGLDPARLHVTVFEEDDESEALWKKILPPGVPVRRLGREDNFWSMGDGAGLPCGPCSEIFFDTQAPGASDEDRFLEIWNLVFMEYQSDGQGGLGHLPRPSVDTGMGLERIASVMQGVDSNFGTDLLAPIVAAADEQLLSRDEEVVRSGLASRVIADHVRAMSFLISDGVVPSNVGRGYVLRRLIRRAIGFGFQGGRRDQFLSGLLPVVQDTFRDADGISAYPELEERGEVIAAVISGEEEVFLGTLETGMKHLNRYFEKRVGTGEVDAAFAFRMYDSYGFPIDLTARVAEERGAKVDVAGYDCLMEAHRARSGGAGEAWAHECHDARGLEPTSQVRAWDTGVEFTGYNVTREDVATVLQVSENTARPSTRWVAISPCPFYAESGGQVSDTGVLEVGCHALPVLSCRVPYSGGIALLVECGELGHLLTPGTTVKALVDEDTRKSCSVHHTATHLLQSALRSTLGCHVTQAGSLVSPDRLRFDFTHPRPLKHEEAHVNAFASASAEVTTDVLSLEQAKKQDILMMFGEKYGDEVRVVEINANAATPDTKMRSAELCGGTHVANTSQIFPFRIVSESSVAAGTRRVEAVAGQAALAWLARKEEALQEIATRLGAKGSNSKDPDEVLELFGKRERRFDELKDRVKELEKSLLEAQAFEPAACRGKIAVHAVPDLGGSTRKETKKAMQAYANSVVERDPENLHFFVCGNRYVVCAKGKGLEKIHAGQVLRQLFQDCVQGKGGGSQVYAQGEITEEDFCLDPEELLDHVERVCKQDNAHPRSDPAEDGVLAVEPRARGECDEELRAVGVGARIGHGQDTSAGVLELGRDLVLELGSPERLAAATGAGGVSALHHKVLTGNAVSGGTGGAITMSVGSGTSGAGGSVALTAGTTSALTGGSVSLTTGDGSATSSGHVMVTTSDGGTAGTSGSVTLRTGDTPDGDTGEVVVITGDATGGAGGAFTVSVGSGTSGAGGVVSLTAGTTSALTGGSVTLTTGAGSATSSGHMMFSTPTGGTTGTSGSVKITTGDTADGEVGEIALATGASTGGKGGDISMLVGGGNTGNGGKLSLSAGASSAATSVGGAVEVTAGASTGATTGTGGDVTVTSGVGATSTGGSISLTTAQGTATSSGHISLTTSGGGTGGTSGSVTVTTGNAPVGNTGEFKVVTGNAVSGGTGGAITMSVGSGTSGAGGAVVMSAGSTNALTGGAITLTSGAGSATSSGHMAFSTPTGGTAGTSGSMVKLGRSH